jgi:hypothetical protein
MFKQFISKLPGADIFMIMSFAVFLAFFIAVSIYLFYMKKDRIDRMSELPLE